jgi:hypothetical protein
MGPNLVIFVSHKIHPTLEKEPIHAIPTSHKILLHWKRGPIHAIPAYQIEFAMEKKTHLCNTYISNATYIGKGNSSMQYLHVALKPI